jgi:DNA repair exonuclease SbcCD nuclease subunit
MKRPLRIAHTSDVHLCNGEEGMPVRRAFTQIIDAVLDTRAELFLIAGDLFDHNRIHDEVVDFVYRELARVSCPTVIIVGNHDCWEERAIMQRMDFSHAGPHITLLDQEDGASVEIPELHATVWGRCMIAHHPDNKPMAAAPGRTRDLWHIGMAHGLYSALAEPGRSSIISGEEIAASGFDYLAMGHVHLHQQFRHGDTLACYPGVCVPYNPRQPGCLALVELTPGEGASACAWMLERKRPVVREKSALAA